MDDYTITSMIGEGSFGRVYKAIDKKTNEIIALKIIGKNGRSDREIRNLRKECEIQSHLNHPNIIRMITSFETSTKLGVVTEFAVSDLHKLLCREGSINEHRVQRLTIDLMSALYYLHSHRILHRDLKPQNILLDKIERAKLCDFGLARNMTLGTHVLTSIKGTPLYMAPELMSEKPYDHLADLWSLGCILYECFTGEPPFCTTSFIRLVRLIKYEKVKWPTFLSQTCISFIQGLLEKNPSDRLCWPHILNHSFIAGKVIIPEEYITDSPFTHPLSASQYREKEKQKKKILRIGLLNQKLIAFEKRKQQTAKNNNKKNNALATSKDSINAILQSDLENIETDTEQNSKNKADNIKNDIDIINDKLKNMNITDGRKTKSNEIDGDGDDNDDDDDNELTDSDERNSTMISGVDSSEDYHSPPIENDEWVAFLQKSMQEILDGETTYIKQQHMLSIVVAPLRNSKTSYKVIECVAQLLSLPLILHGPQSLANEIQDVYVEGKLVPNLIYASKLICHKRIKNTNKKYNQPSATVIRANKTRIEPLTTAELKSLVTTYRLICYLVHLNDHFLSQFCDAVAILGIEELLIYFLSHGTENDLTILLTNSVISLLTYVLRELPENAELIEKIVFHESVNIMSLMKNNDSLLRSRMCMLLRIAGRFSCVALQNIWTPEIKEILECLMFDSNEEVRNNAASTQTELALLSFYNISNNNDSKNNNNIDSNDHNSNVGTNQNNDSKNETNYINDHISNDIKNNNNDIIDHNIIDSINKSNDSNDHTINDSKNKTNDSKNNNNDINDHNNNEGKNKNNESYVYNINDSINKSNDSNDSKNKTNDHNINDSKNKSNDNNVHNSNDSNDHNINESKNKTNDSNVHHSNDSNYQSIDSKNNSNDSNADPNSNDSKNKSNASNDDHNSNDGKNNSNDDNDISILV